MLRSLTTPHPSLIPLPLLTPIQLSPHPATLPFLIITPEPTLTLASPHTSSSCYSHIPPHHVAVPLLLCHLFPYTAIFCHPARAAIPSPPYYLRPPHSLLLFLCYILTCYLLSSLRSSSHIRLREVFAALRGKLQYKGIYKGSIFRQYRQSLAVR